MYIDIHTHRAINPDSLSIHNLKFDDAESVLQHVIEGHFSVGIHPWDVHTYSPNDIDELRGYCLHESVVAVGECGLDKHSTATVATQTAFFIDQITISEQLEKPLIIHCVGCFNEVLRIKKEIKPVQPWIIHGFRGKPQLAKQLLRAGFYLSYGEHFNAESVKITPLEKLMIETDESTKDIADIYQAISDSKSIDIDQLKTSQIVFKNLFLGGFPMKTQ